MAAAPWRPAEILKIFINTEEHFDCLAQTQQGRRCRNPIGRSKRIQGKETLNEISMMDNTSDDFTAVLEDLADVLLCSQSRHNETQNDCKVYEWQLAIDEFREAEKVRKRRDTVMGEVTDAPQELLDEISDLVIRYRRITTSDDASPSPEMKRDPDRDNVSRRKADFTPDIKQDPDRDNGSRRKADFAPDIKQDPDRYNSSRRKGHFTPSPSGTKRWNPRP